MTMLNRGEDGAAVADGELATQDVDRWADAAAGVTFGAMNEPSFTPGGAAASPVRPGRVAASPSGRYRVVFDGEILGAPVLIRSTRAARSPLAATDLEAVATVAETVERLGVTGALEALEGAFALAVWDSLERTLTIARDPLGLKPAYYGWQGGVLLFGSELRSLAQHPACERRVDQAALAAYLQLGYTPAPSTIYAGLRKLPPGSAWRWTVSETASDERPAAAYWSLPAAIEGGARSRFAGTPDEALDELGSRLSAAVRSRLPSDQRPAALLSGGIDSALVAALVQEASGGQLRTFTVGYEEARLDESGAAREVARHLGTAHEEFVLTATDALTLVGRLGDVMDEPVGDVSLIPTWHAYRAAGRHARVVFAGDGGDELFAGYSKYPLTAGLWRRLERVPGPLRGTAAAALRFVPSRAIGEVLMAARVGAHPHLFAARVRRLRVALSSSSVDALYRERNRNWPDVREVLRSGASEATAWADDLPLGTIVPTERMMAYDALAYLPDGVAMKVDRATLAHGVTSRAPILDLDVVSFAWQLDPGLKLRGGTLKWPLRALLARYVPEEMVSGPKRGFDVPLAEWLRGEMRPLAEELLSKAALEDDGPFVAEPIRRVWQQHLSGVDLQYQLWPLLAYQLWARSAGQGA